MVTTKAGTGRTVLDNELVWVEVSRGALAANARAFKARVAPTGARLGVVVKADAYGHGLELAARAFLEGGADWLVVNGLHEAEALRAAGIEAPIHVVGNVPAWMAERVVAARVRMVVYDAEVARAMAAAGRAAGVSVPLHVKVETGNHRQGLEPADALALGRLIAELEGVELEGLATHYADIEDTTDHRFAMGQVERFEAALAAFREAGLAVPVPSTANSAATILWPRTHGALVRVGIAAYGLWPSTETYAAALALPEQREGRGGFLPELRPALAWKTRIVQVKDVPQGAWVGYGRTYRCTHAARIAVIPVGYHEGYDRRLSNLAHVLVDGVRAPVRGRVCMNMAMIEVSDVPRAQVGSVVTLLGSDGDERVSAEDLGRWCGTINYEIVSRIHPALPRVGVD
ncbi:MAG: alanine racemase [Deltaproteobacteria bacterium]|nr:alanine racemase [Deltaproteobacteria bacterium]